jgi:hypothetical protein
MHSMPNKFITLLIFLQLACSQHAGVGHSVPTTSAFLPAARLSGDTNDPEASTFVLGQKVELAFHVHGQPKEATSLQLTFVDEHERIIQKRSLEIDCDEHGDGALRVVDPRCESLGFYRVYAQLSDGTKLAALGTRAEGFLTYAIVPDPSRRKDYGVDGSRFGMEGCLTGHFGPWRDRILAGLGVRWVFALEPEPWRICEPLQAGTFDADALVKKHENSNASPAWKTYPFPTLMWAPDWAVKSKTLEYFTGVLTPEGEKAWVEYCRKAAGAFAVMHPEMNEHIYQITEFPCAPWGFGGSDDELIRIYELAYPAIHQADPRALVVGPSRNNMNAKEVTATAALFERGLGKFIDGYAVLPDCYTAENRETDPELVQHLREIRAMLLKHTGRDVPMIGTRQQSRINEKEDPAQDLVQAQTLIRENLVVLGEGFRFNMASYLADARFWGGWERMGFGYYYNLSPKPSLRFTDLERPPSKIGPKPVVPAYAVQSMLIDGHTSLGPIAKLSGTAMGYAFVRDNDAVLALWDYGPKTSNVVLPIGEGQIIAYDWMGASKIYRDKGLIELTLGPEPVYVTGLSAESARRLVGRN